MGSIGFDGAPKMRQDPRKMTTPDPAQRGMAELSQGRRFAPNQGLLAAASHLGPKNSLICSNSAPCRTLSVLSTVLADHNAPLAAFDPLTSPQCNAALTAFPFSKVTTGSIVKSTVWASFPSFASSWH